MRRLAFATAVAVVVAFVAACADPVAPAVPITPAAPALTAGSTGKVAVCRESGKLGSGKFDQQLVSSSNIGSYFDENGVPLVGHENDYLVTDRTPCPPPSAPGELQICILGNTNLWLGTSFTYLVNGVPVTVTPNECAVRAFRVGTHVHVAQAVTSGTQLTAIAVEPTGAGASTLTAATADVVIGTDRATASFTNVSIGTLRICTAAASGVTAGTAFDYLVLGRRVSTGADGTCADIAGVPTGAIHVQQVVPSSVLVTDVTASPYLPTAKDFANGAADVYVAKGQTSTVTFVDAVNGAPAALLLCAAKGPAIVSSTTASFSVRGNSYTLPVGGVGSCTTLTGLPLSGLRVQAIPTLTEVITGINFQPPLVPFPFTSTAVLVSSDVPRGTAVVDLDPFFGAAQLTFTVDAR
jgi:hypothetical protein